MCGTCLLILSICFTVEISGEIPDDNVWDLPEESENQSVEEHKSVILHLLSQLKLGMDLTKVSGHPQLFS